MSLLNAVLPLDCSIHFQTENLKAAHVSSWWSIEVEILSHLRAAATIVSSSFCIYKAMKDTYTYKSFPWKYISNDFVVLHTCHTNTQGLFKELLGGT